MSAAAGDTVMSARGITKDYGGIRALKGVDFDIRRGKVTVLFGENGAGKSTLMKILSGVEPPTSGRIVLDGEEVSFASANEAAARGVAIIHQELNLAPNLSVADNIFMGHELLTAAGVGVRFGAERERAARALERLEERIDPDTLVADLRLGQQQLVEIAKALEGDARVLIMDEPTSALSSVEVEVLFRVIDELKRDGVAIVYISHHLEEAVAIADHAVVFRDGELVATERAENIDVPWVVRQMVGRTTEVAPVELGRELGDVALSIRDFSVIDPSRPDRLAVDSFTLELRRGEIVCLYGLMGAGRTELLEALAGRINTTVGEVRLGGAEIDRFDIARRIGSGLALVPEDRQRDGLAQNLSVRANLSLAAITSFVRGVFLSERREAEAADRQITDVRLKTPSPTAPVTALSGGNQQKVVIGKILMTEPDVLLLDEPSRGIDVGAKGEIFALMAREAERGLAVLYATSEVSEALGVAHRILVMSRGRVVGSFDPRTTTRAEIMSAADEGANAVASGARTGYGDRS